MKLNKTLFLDIEGTLTKTKSGREFPLNIADWKFNDNIVVYIQDAGFDSVVLIGNRNVSQIFDKKEYDKFINLVFDTLFKITDIPIYVVSNHSEDMYLNYPNPGGIFSICLENDIDLKNSMYIANSSEALSNSCIGTQCLDSSFI